MNGNENISVVERVLTADELRQYREQLAALAIESAKNGTLTKCDIDLWNRIYNPYTSDAGMQIYQSFTRDELLEILQDAAERCGGIPTKKDIFYVYAHYLKRRFNTLANALCESGYKINGYFSKDSIRVMLLNASEEESEAFFKILCAKEIREHDHSPSKDAIKDASKIVRPLFGSHKDLKKAVDVMRDAERFRIIMSGFGYDEECAKLLHRLKGISAKLGRTPLRAEVPLKLGTELWLTYGSWNNVLNEAGLKPLTGEALKTARYEYMLATACTENIPLTYRKMLDEEDIKALDRLCETARQLGRIPTILEAKIPVHEFRTY